MCFMRYDLIELFLFQKKRKSGFMQQNIAVKISILLVKELGMGQDGRLVD